MLQFINWAFNPKYNIHIAWHLLGGTWGAIGMVALGFPLWAIAVVVASLAVLWEIVELVYDEFNAIYGSTQRWLADCTGDIVGAVAYAVIATLILG